MHSKKGKIFVVSGPSGVGKGTVVGEVLKNLQNIYLSVSATTRQKREGEKDGINYFFKTKEKFQEMIDSDEFLEWADFAGDYYGTPKHFVNNYITSCKDVLLEIEIKGAKQIKEKCKEAVLIFLAPPSFETLEERLIKRQTESLEKIKIRLNKAKEEMNQINLFNYLVVNDDLKEAVNNVTSIIKAERCKII